MKYTLKEKMGYVKINLEESTEFQKKSGIKLKVI